MKKIKQFLWLCSWIVIVACSNDDTITPQKPESRDVVSLEYESRQFDFKNFHHGKYTNENRELIGFFIESEIVIDEQHKNRILFLFKTDFKNNVEFAGIEFSPFKPGPIYPHNVFAYVYQYTTDEYGTPFNIDIKMENGRITGTFEGYVHRGIDYTLEPVHLSSGKIDIEAKATND